jgi:predicted ATPase
MRFTHVNLVNWRNFKSVDVALQRRVFLFGPNASGKSNFLDAFRFLSDLTVVGGGFQDAIQRRGGVSILRCLAARESSDIAVTVQIGDDEDPNLWRYELRFNQDKQRRPIIKREQVMQQGRIILDRPDPEDDKDPERLSQTYLEQVYANQRFREIATFFSSIRYLHIVPQLVREPDRSIGRINDPFGGDFLEQIASTREQTQKARLRRIKEALAIAVPQLTDLELKRDNKGTPHLRGKYKHWRSKGAWLDEDQLSDGTLRLMGLLWAMLDGGNSPLLLEEPELSLHPEVIRVIPQMFARVQNRLGKQILISTHSGDLLNDTGISPDEVLVLLPESEGTSVNPASSFEEVTALGTEINLADILIPLTRPEDVQQLPLFADEKR